MSDLIWAIKTFRSFVENTSEEDMRNMIKAIEKMEEERRTSRPPWQPKFKNVNPDDIVIIRQGTDSHHDLFTELHACIPDESGIKALHRTKYEQWLTKNGLK